MVAAIISGGTHCFRAASIFSCSFVYILHGGSHHLRRHTLLQGGVHLLLQLRANPTHHVHLIIERQRPSFSSIISCIISPMPPIMVVILSMLLLPLSPLPPFPFLPPLPTLPPLPPLPPFPLPPAMAIETIAQKITRTLILGVLVDN